MVLRWRSTFVWITFCTAGLLASACTPPTDKAPPGMTEVRVLEFLPAGLISPTSAVEIRFDRDVAEEPDLHQDLTNVGIKVTPPVPGVFRFVEKNRLVFLPQNPLKPGEAFTVSLPEKLFADQNLFLVGDREHEYATATFEVKSVEPFFNTTSGKPRIENAYVNIEFSWPVRPEDADKYVSFMTTGKQPLPAQIDTKNAQAVIAYKLQPKSGNRQDGGFIIVVDPALTAAAGGKPLPGRFEKEISAKTAEPVTLSSTNVYQHGDGWAISFRFSTSVVVESDSPYVDVEPKVPYRVERSYRGLQIVGDFESLKTYTVTIQKGLPAVSSGGALEETIKKEFTIPDLPPQLAWRDQGTVLSRRGNMNISLETVNLEAVDLEIHRVFDNNIVHYLPSPPGAASSSNDYDDYYYEDYYYSDYGRRVDPSLGRSIYSQKIAVAKKTNQKVHTTVALEDVLKDKGTGAFVVTARERDKLWQDIYKVVLVTDLGITAKRTADEIFISVRSLKTHKPIAGADVRLLSSNNQTLLTGRTNANGNVLLSGVRSAADGFVPFLVTATKGKDYAYLDLSKSLIPTADFDTGGIGGSAGYEAYVYADRGVFRPGDVAHLVAVVRDDKLRTPPAFPLALEVKDPRQRTFARARGTTKDDGVWAYDLEIPSYAATGRYVAEIQIPGRGDIGRLAFQVEDFIPDRIKVDLTFDKERYSKGDTITADVKGTYLFGPPAKNLPVEAECRVDAAPFRPAKYKSFAFGAGRQPFKGWREDLGATTLDDGGLGKVKCALPSSMKPPSRARATITATVTEPGGGRGVTQLQSALVDVYPVHIGVRRNTDHFAEKGEDAGVEFIVLGPDGDPVKGRKLKVRVSEVTYKTVLKNVRGRYRYVSERSESPLSQADLTSNGDVQGAPFSPKRYGSYVVEVEDTASGASSELSFYAAGPGYAPWAMEDPDQVELEPENDAYAVGENAVVMVRAPFAGTLVVSVERQSVLDTFTVKMTGNTDKIRIPIKPGYAPNVYVTAQLLRSNDKRDRRAPLRAFGATPVYVKYADKKVGVKLDAPDVVRPHTKMTVDVSATNTVGSPVLTLAAVDEGILQLTNQKSPNPLRHFFAKRRLGVATHDMYADVLPEVSGQQAQSSSGGDGELERKHQNPVQVKRVKPVALWSGVVHLDGAGRGRVTFDVPEFQGQLRLMAVVVSGDRFGAKSAPVTVRDPIVVTPTFPRFLSPKDKFEIPVMVYNGTKNGGSFKVWCESKGKVAIDGKGSETLQLNVKEQKRVIFHGTAADGTGKVQMACMAEGNDEKTVSTVELPLRAASPLVTEGISKVVPAGEEITLSLSDQFYPEGASVSLTASGLPGLKLAASLAGLVRYPHGCLEQTTSKLFPLLYFNDVVRVAQPDLLDGGSVDAYLEAGIRKLASMQRGDGSFSYWPGSGYGYSWASVYASHFLVEAARQSHAVEQRVLDRLATHLSLVARRADYNTSFYRSGRSLRVAVYAQYVLALLGKPERGAMLYARDQLMKKADPDTRILLGGAFALIGDMSSAKKLMPTSAQEVKFSPETGGDFNSPLRRDAILLSILQDVQPDSDAVPTLVKRVEQKMTAYNMRYSTQELGYALLALGKVMRDAARTPVSGTVTVQGEQSAFGQDGTRLSGVDLLGKTITVRADSGRVYVTGVITGLKKGDTLKPVSEGITLERTLLDEEGNAVSGTVPQGQLLIVQLKAKSKAKHVRNAVLVDMLPAGFEIENPRLKGRGDTSFFKDRSTPDFMDIRDDRMIFFTDLSSQGSTFYYVVRAVTPGTFQHAPTLAEAMYDPSVRAVGKPAVQTVGRVQ